MKNNKKAAVVRSPVAIRVPDSPTGRKLSARLELCRTNGTGALELGQYAMAGYMLLHRIEPDDRDFLGALEAPLREALTGARAPLSPFTASVATDLPPPPTVPSTHCDPSPESRSASAAQPLAKAPPAQGGRGKTLQEMFLFTG